MPHKLKNRAPPFEGCLHIGAKAKGSDSNEPDPFFGGLKPALRGLPALCCDKTSGGGILMGGPGVSALSCVQHISDAAEMVRALKNAENSGASDELRLSIVSVLEQLAEAKLAGLEAQEEINSLSAYAEMRDVELGYFKGPRSVTQLAAPVAPLPPPEPPSSGEAQQAANLTRMASFAAADQGFRSLDTFASWFVGGTAAAVGLMIANFEKIEPFIGSLDLQWTLVKVVIALGLVGVAKFFGSLVCTMARGTERVLEIVEQWEKRGWPIPSEKALQAAREAALPAPFNWVPKKFMQRSYDPLAQARQIMRFLMLAGLSTLTAVGLVIAVLVDIAMAL